MASLRITQQDFDKLSRLQKLEYKVGRKDIEERYDIAGTVRSANLYGIILCFFAISMAFSNFAYRFTFVIMILKIALAWVSAHLIFLILDVYMFVKRMREHNQNFFKVNTIGEKNARRKQKKDYY